MDTMGVLSLLPSCPGWWFLIGCSASDAAATAAVSVLCGRGDRCCCESLGGVAWFPTHPMSFEECRAACCYLGDRSTPPTICTTRILSRLQGSLEEDVIKEAGIHHMQKQGQPQQRRFYYQSDEGAWSPRWGNPARCPRSDPLQPLTRTKEPRGFNLCSLYPSIKQSYVPLSVASTGKFLEESSVDWTGKDGLGENTSPSSGHFPISPSDGTGELLS